MGGRRCSGKQGGKEQMAAETKPVFEVSVLRWSVWRWAEGLPTHRGWMAEGLDQSE